MHMRQHTYQLSSQSLLPYNITASGIAFPIQRAHVNTLQKQEFLEHQKNFLNFVSRAKDGAPTSLL